MAKRFDTGSGPSQRQLRVGEIMRHALAEVLARGEIHDPVLQQHVVTVPEVPITSKAKAHMRDLTLLPRHRGVPGPVNCVKVLFMLSKINC